MTQLEVAILKTLAYADLFDQALATDELSSLLIGYKLDTPSQLASAKVTGVSHKRDLWSLSSRRHLFEYKSQQLHTTHHKRLTAKRWLWAFKLIPWIELVAITGSVAGGSPDANDDIDLLIITDKNRLWLSRLWLLPLLSMFRVRRRPNDDPARVNNKLCLNMWRSTAKLKEEHRDLYTAMELARMIPLLNRNQTYQRYIDSNGWMMEILPNWQLVEKSGVRSSAVVAEATMAKSAQKSDGAQSRHPELVSGSKRQTLNQVQHDSHWTRALDKLDTWTQQLQLSRMRPRTNETIKSAELKFHPRDYRIEVLSKYQKKLTKLGLS